MKISELNNLILQEIALARPMGCQVKSVESLLVELTAPLSTNSNHLGTAFGGSQAALALLSCWALLANWLSDESLAFEAIVKESHCKYKRPIQTDFTARCQWPLLGPSQADVLLTLKTHQRANITLSSEVFTDGTRACSELSADFVLRPH